LPGHLCFPDFTPNIVCAIAKSIVIVILYPNVFKKGGHICLLSALVRLLCRIIKFAKAYIEYPDFNKFS